MTLDDFKGRNADYSISVQTMGTDECYDAVPEKAIADIASNFNISNEDALAMLQVSADTEMDIICEHKKAIFWVNKVAR